MFGGGQNSVYNALENEYDIYTLDITKPTREKHLICDLSQPIEIILETLNNLPKPDIIVSSPLCQSFSVVFSMKGGGTCFWKLNEDKTLLVERSVEEFERLKNGFTRSQNADNQLKWKRIGEQFIRNTILIISIFNPKYWYIENPKTSLIWKYLTLNCKYWYHLTPKYMNKCAYGMYGFPTDKKTIFLSNVKMNLKDGSLGLRQRARSKYGSGITYGLNLLKTSGDCTEKGVRSSIPKELIKDIFSYFKE